MVEHLAPDRVAEVPPLAQRPRHPDIDDVVLHSETIWRTIDGYTDEPAQARPQDGARWFDACAQSLAGRIVDLAASF